MNRNQPLGSNTTKHDAVDSQRTHNKKMTKIKLSQLPNTQIDVDLKRHNRRKAGQNASQITNSSLNRKSIFSQHGSSIDTTQALQHFSNSEVADDIRRSVRMPLKSQVKQRNHIQRNKHFQPKNNLPHDNNG